MTQWNHTKEELLGSHRIHIDNGGIDIEVVKQSLVVKDQPEQGECAVGAVIVISNSFYGHTLNTMTLNTGNAEGMPFQKEDLLKLSEFFREMADKL